MPGPSSSLLIVGPRLGLPPVRGVYDSEQPLPHLLLAHALHLCRLQRPRSLQVCEERQDGGTQLLPRQPLHHLPELGPALALACKAEAGRQAVEAESISHHSSTGSQKVLRSVHRRLWAEGKAPRT